MQKGPYRSVCWPETPSSRSRSPSEGDHDQADCDHDDCDHDFGDVGNVKERDIIFLWQNEWLFSDEKEFIVTKMLQNLEGSKFGILHPS